MPNPRITARVEEELQSGVLSENFFTDDPALYILYNHQNIPDAAAYVRKLREPRGKIRLTFELTQRSWTNRNCDLARAENLIDKNARAVILESIVRR